MKKLLAWALALSMVLVSTVPAMAADPVKPEPKAIPIVAVEAQDQAGIDELNAAGLDIIAIEDGYVALIMVGDYEKEYFAANDIEYIVIEDDATAQVDWLGYELEGGNFSTFAAPIPGIPGSSTTGDPSLEIDVNAMFDPTDVAFDEKYGFPKRLGYRTVTEYYGEMNYLAALYPELVKMEVIGTSVEGVPIYALEICNEPGKRDGRPETFHMAGNHSREWPTNELAMNLTWYLLTQYGKNSEVTAMLDSTRVWMVPMSNPDGVHYDQRNNPGTWRKNRTLNPDGTYGIDINRNWSYRWGSNNGSSSDYNSGTYRGVAPNSEPETQAVISVYKNNQIISSISGHTSGQLVIFAWAYVNNPNNAHPLLGELARKQADINLHADQNGNVMYAQSGEINDYLWGAVRALGFTYEYGTSFVPAYGGYDRYKAIAPYNDYYGNQRRIPLTYPTAQAAAGARAPATDLAAPVAFMTEPYIIGYGSTDRFATAAKVQAMGDLTGKILMTHQAANTTDNTAVVLAAQAAGAVGVIFCGNAVSGGGYGHYTPSLAGNNVGQVTIPVAGTSKPYCREFNEYVENGGENMIVLTSYMENTDSLYAQFERQIGAYMLNMSFAKDYASHIKGRIVDSSARAIPSAALDLEIEIESIILNTDGSERPAGTFTETQTAHYDVTGGTYDWNVLPSKQPEFPDAGYDITASADGRYSATKNVKVGFYQETQDGVDFVLPEAITSSFNFNSRPAKDAPVTIPFTTYALSGGSSSPGAAGVVSVTVDGAPATVVSQGNGEYIAQFTPTAEGKSEVVIDFAGGPEHSALVRTLDVVDLSVPKAQVRFSGPTAVAPGAESEYILSVANAPNLANAVITFEVDGRYMTPKKAEAVATSFPLLGDVEWVKLPGDKYQGKAILWSDSRNIDATASTDILKLTFEAGQVLGNGSVKVTGISMANLIYSGNNPPTGSAFIPAEFTGSDSITVAIGPIPSKYDIDNNGVIDQRDLARAQYYYKVRVGDIRWNQSGHIGYRADVNGDGVVDILDFIEILANIA